MNNQRRKILGKLADELTELQCQIQSVLDEEEESFENMPEGLQGGERGEMMQAAIGNLEDAVSSIDDITSNLTDAAQ